MVKMNSTNLLVKLSYTILFSAAITIIYFWYLLFWPMRVIDEKSPFTVLNPNKQVEHGGVLIYEEQYCKYRSLPAITTILLHDGVVIGLPLRYGNLPVGCGKHVSYAIIPDVDIVRGKNVFLSFTRVYKVNEFRSITTYAETERFEVVDK